MKKALITLLQYIVFLGLGIFIVYYTYNKLTAEEKAHMFEAIGSVSERWYLIIPAVIGGFLSHYFRALRWKLLLEPIGIRPSTTNTLFSVLIGYLANLVIYRSGEVAKCTVLARYEKVPADKMVGTIVSERVFDMLSLGVVVALAFALQADVIGNYATELIQNIWTKAGNLLFIGIVGLVGLIIVLVYIYRRTKETRVGKFIKGLSEGMHSILKLKNRGMFLLYSVLIWVLYWFMVMLGFWALPATEHMSGAAGLVVLVFGSVGMIVTQGGVGAYPLLVSIILASCYHINTADGLAFGWVSWTAQTAILIILGIVSLILLPLYNRHKQTSRAQAAMDTR